MSQSDAGKGDGHRPVLVSREEHEFRKSVAWGEIKVSERAYKRRINKIRKKTGKP